MKTKPPAQAAVAAGWSAMANPNRRIPASEVRELCGDVSDMTIHRWLNRTDLNFPKPIYIGRRRYWKEADVLAWLEAQPRAKGRAA